MRNTRKEQIISALPLPAQPVDAAVRLTRRLSPEERVRKVIEIIGTQVAQPREVESAVSRLLEDISRHQAQRRRRSKQRLKKWGRDFRRAARKKRPFELRSRDGFEVHFGSEPFDSERFARELGSLKAIADLYAKAKLEPKPLFDSRASQPGLCSG